MSHYNASIPEVIGNRIRNERLNHHMTQAQFAAMLGISTSYLGALERGVRPVSRRILERLHDRLNISYDYLLDGVSSRKTAARSIVAEPEAYRLRRSFSYLLNTCSQDEMRQCYRLLYTYLNCLHSSDSLFSKKADTP